jgi:hypothetical protein
MLEETLPAYSLLFACVGNTCLVSNTRMCCIERLYVRYSTVFAVFHLPFFRHNVELPFPVAGCRPVKVASASNPPRQWVLRET